VACAGLSLLGATACKSDPDGAQPTQPSAVPSATAPWRLVETFADRLAAAAVAADGAKVDSEVACPDDAIRQRLGQGGGRLLVAEREYLERYRDPAAAPRHRGGDEHWRFLTTPSLRDVRSPVELESPRAAVEAAYRVRQLENDYRYLAVIVSSERTPPALDGQKYRSGALSGLVVVFPIDRPTPLCQATFTAANDDTVVFRDPARREEALWQDFALRTRQSLDVAVGRITRHLNLDLE
jgi:hypothetical protein